MIAPEVLELTVSEVQLNDVQAGGLLLSLWMYWFMFNPQLERTYVPAAGARALEFQNVLNLLSGPGIWPFVTLIGRIRNLHRFSIPTLTALVTNFGDTSRSRPVHLVLHTGHDAASFQNAAPLFEDLVVNSPNLVLMLEGQASLASITAEIPIISSTYGQPDGTGNFRIAQAMIVGHGQARSVQLAGTGTPTVRGGGVTYPSESLDLDRNLAATNALLDTLLGELDPATARLVYAGCLVGSNPVPLGTPAASVPGHIATNPSLGAYTEQRGVALGLSSGFVRAARASTSTASAASLMDASGNLEIEYTFDPAAYGSAAAYVAVGHEPEGLFRAAVEVAATAGPAVAESLLRIRLIMPVVRGWWDETTLALVNVALTGVAPGSGVSVSQLNTIAHLAEIPFLARWPGNFGITVGHFTSRVNSQPLASDVYTQISATPTFTTPSDADARAMRLIVEQGWLALGAAREAPLIIFLDATPQLTAVVIERHLSISAIAANSATLFSSGAAVTSGRIRLALAWLRVDPTNADVRAFLNGQVSVVGTTPTLSAAVTSELDGFTEREILESLDRLTPTATVAVAGAAPLTLPTANVEIGGAGVNRVRVEPHPYIATVLPHALNVRRFPSMRGAVFDWLSRGDSVQVMGFTHNWAAIDQNGQLGFVHRNELTPPP